MKRDDSFWMAVSGTAGIVLLLIANFTSVFHGSAVVFGILQLVANAFVFFTWTRAFLRSSGFKRFVTFFGVVVPVLFAGVTLWRILIPWILQ